jgi:type IV pilus assembly protein PilB
VAYVPRLVRKKLGELLVETGLIKEDQLQAALNMQQKNGRPLGEILVEINLVKEEDIAFVLSKQYGLPYLDASKYLIQGDVKSVIPAKMMLDQRFVVLDRIGRFLIVAISGVINTELLDQLEAKSSATVYLYISTQSQVLASLKKYYGVG